MPNDFMSPDSMVDLKMVNFSPFEVTYYSYFDLEEDGYLFIKKCVAVKSASGSSLPQRGSFSLYDSNKNEINIPSYYSYFEEKYQYVTYVITLYAIEVPAGRYYISVVHEAWDGIACYQLAVSDQAFVDKDGVPY